MNDDSNTTSESLAEATREAELRDRWIAQVAALLGPASPQFDPKQYATDMAAHYYDEPIAEGCEPDEPSEAVHDEFQAGL